MVTSDQQEGFFMKYKNCMVPRTHSIGADFNLQNVSMVKFADDIKHCALSDNEGVADVLLNTDISGSGH
jgi:hypothetical protein